MPGFSLLSVPWYRSRPSGPQWVAQASRTMGIDEPSRVLLKKCAPKRHRWRQPIKFIPVISLHEGSISVDFFWICSYDSSHVMASNLKSGSSFPSLLYYCIFDINYHPNIAHINMQGASVLLLTQAPTLTAN